MTILNIYSLDDTEEENVIACLPEGKHLIGRGDLLQVTDKRVSRKHATIEVLSNQILLTSVHVNPCFFKAANSNTLSVLSQNQQSVLNDGDRFALLPESCWFRVKISREHAISGSSNGLNNSKAEINGKRQHDNNSEENNSDSESKRARWSTTSHNTTHNEDDSATTTNITSDIATTVQSESAFQHQENKELYEPPEEQNAEERNKSLNVAETEGIQNEMNENEGVNKGTDKDIKEEPKEYQGDLSATTSNNLLLHASTSNNELENSSNNDNDTVHNSTTENPKIKEEPLNDSNKEGGTGENDIPIGNNVSNDQPAEVKTEKEDNSEKKDGASGSGTDPKKVHRERCWYGAQCFRKNPIHRESFTHPGDEDYESDADDDRPECPYGTSCYRKNSEHRRDYKHTGKPAPKPSNVNVMLNVNSGCPFCQHCINKRGGKPDYESDADDEGIF